MAYADTTAVKARAGRIGDAWGAASGRRPNAEDLTAFLDEVADELDALIAGLGHTTPVTDAAADALRSTNIDGALVMALEATFPGEMPSDVETLYSGVQKRYERAWKMLSEGKHPALGLIERTPGPASGSSLWSEEPTYGETEPSGPDLNVNLRPGFFRGHPL